MGFPDRKSFHGRCLFTSECNLFSLGFLQGHCDLALVRRPSDPVTCSFCFA